MRPPWVWVGGPGRQPPWEKGAGDHPPKWKAEIVGPPKKGGRSAKTSPAAARGKPFKKGASQKTEKTRGGPGELTGEKSGGKNRTGRRGKGVLVWAGVWAPVFPGGGPGGRGEPRKPSGGPRGENGGAPRGKGGKKGGPKKGRGERRFLGQKKSRENPFKKGAGGPQRGRGPAKKGGREKRIGPNFPPGPLFGVNED